ncbi:MAG: alpha-galactosidase, partial [Eubacterium sp.]|nr:alpha-galactosidase [Eubacterium sp.]
MELKFSFQLKLRGDDFNGHFTNGLSMANSISVHRCKKVFEDNDKTIFEADTYRVTAYHIEKSNIRECYSVFENLSDKVLTLDMLSSFCIENIVADKMHRATSFWSAEGKLLSQKLTELNMEKSWSGHGTRVEKFGQIGSMPVRKYFPFAALENTKTSEFIAVQLYCASSWQIELFR